MSFFKDRTLTFIVFYSLCIAYLITILLFSVLAWDGFIPLLLGGSLFILISTFMMDFLPLTLLLSLSVLITTTVFMKSRKVEFRIKDFVKIILLLLFCLMVFIPLQLFLRGIIGEVIGKV